MSNRVRIDMHMYALLNNIELEIKLLTANAEGLIKGGVFSSQEEVNDLLAKLEQKRDRISAIRANSDILHSITAPSLTKEGREELARLSHETDLTLLRLSSNDKNDDANEDQIPCDAPTSVEERQAYPAQNKNPTRKVAALESPLSDATESDNSDPANTGSGMPVYGMRPYSPEIIPLLHGEIESE